MAAIPILQLYTFGDLILTVRVISMKKPIQLVSNCQKRGIKYCYIVVKCEPKVVLNSQFPGVSLCFNLEVFE